MRAIPVARAFLSFTIHPVSLSLPNEIVDVLREHFQSIPTDLFLPWPTGLSMAVGQKISLSGLPAGLGKVVIDEIDHYYTSDGGVETYLSVSLTDSDRRFDCLWLYCAAEEGFLLESRASLKKVLQKAGLYKRLTEKHGKQKKK